ncbi:hypothetical protein C8Q76DRAFT_694224 [Earliella scabrosa]|nr:hypothetical protein C8Q76DRAFT_694224 [Earliella scabrosa]
MVTRLNCGWMAGLRHSPRSSGGTIATIAAMRFVCFAKMPAKRVSNAYVQALSTSFGPPPGRLIRHAEHACAVARTRKHEIRRALMQLGPSLNMLIVSEVQVADGGEGIIQDAGASLAAIHTSLENQNYAQSHVLARIKVEVAKSSPEVLLTSAGEIVTIAELHQVVVQYQSLISELDALSTGIQRFTYYASDFWKIPCVGTTRWHKDLAGPDVIVPSDTFDTVSDGEQLGGARAPSGSDPRDVGIQGLEDDRKLRKDLLRALTMRNSKYRSSTLRMLRREAREIRAQDLAAPVREELARAMISQSTLHANVEELSSLLDRKMGQAAPTLMAAYRENTTTIRDLPVLDTMLYEPTFEVMLQPLKGPLPSRTQKRPLYRLMAQISSLRRMRQRAVKRTDGSRELTVEEARQIWHQAQRLGWKQNELIARLEGLFITAEMMPSSLRLLAGRTTSIEAIIGSVKRYRKVKIGLEVLQQAFPQIIDIYPFVAANCNSQFLVSTLCRSLCPASQHMEFDGYRSRHRPIRDSVTLAPPLEPYPTEEASMSDSSTSSSEASFVTASDGDPAPTLSGYDMQGIEEENVSLSYATNLIAGPMGAITSGNSAGGASHTRRSTKRHTRSPSPNTTGRSSESGRVSKRARTTPQSPPARNPRSMRRPRRDGTAVHRTSLSAGTVQSRVAVPGTSHAGLAGSGASVDPFLSPVAECTALTVPQSSPDAGSSCTHCCALEVQVQQMRSDIDDIRRDVRDVREALDILRARVMRILIVYAP